MSDRDLDAVAATLTFLARSHGTLWRASRDRVLRLTMRSLARDARAARTILLRHRLAEFGRLGGGLSADELAGLSEAARPPRWGARDRIAVGMDRVAALALRLHGFAAVAAAEASGSGARAALVLVAGSALDQARVARRAAAYARKKGDAA